MSYVADNKSYVGDNKSYVGVTNTYVGDNKDLLSPTKVLVTHYNAEKNNLMLVIFHSIKYIYSIDYLQYLRNYIKTK